MSTHREPNLTDLGAPEDPYDHDAWAVYLRKTTAEPSDADLLGTLLEFGNPYAEQRAKSVEGYRNTARGMWQSRAVFGRQHPHTQVMRNAMRTYAALVRLYDRLALSWAVGQLADSRRDSMRAAF